MSNIFTRFAAWVSATFKEIYGEFGPKLSADVLADAKVIGTGIMGILSAVQTITGVNTANAAALVSKISAAALSIASTVESNLALPIYQQFSTDYAALKTLLAGDTLPVAVKDVFNAIDTLLPFIEAGLGLLTADNASASETVKVAEASGVSEAEARLILKAA